MLFSSRHIGSLVGVAGSSGIHVKPLVPFLRMVICILSSKIAIVAFVATASGAADIAFFITAALSAACAGICPRQVRPARTEEDRSESALSSPWGRLPETPPQRIYKLPFVKEQKTCPKSTQGTN